MKTEYIDLRFLHGDDGRAYYAKGHVPIDAFLAAVRSEVGDDDPILAAMPQHCWMRVCRDFQEGASLLIEATPGSRGAFRATWILEN